jgi:hypothetical protein
LTALAPKYKETLCHRNKVFLVLSKPASKRLSTQDFSFFNNRYMLLIKCVVSIISRINGKIL